MKYFLGGFLFFSVLFGLYAEAYAAAYSNDSSSVDINYVGSSQGSISDEDFVGEDDPSEGEGEEFQETPSEDGSGGETGVTIPVTIITESGTGDDAEGTSDEEESVPLTPEDLLSTLFGHQGVFFGSNSGSGSNGWGTITISGEKARAALLARGVTRLSVSDLLNSRFFTREDFTIVAASRILENRSIEEVILTLDTLTLTYRSDGRLFAVFPFSYPIKLTISPNADTREKRVQVKFPWYRFFLQTFVSRSELQNQIDTAITKVLLDSEMGADLRTKILIAVTDTIQSRFDTVEGTLK